MLRVVLGFSLSLFFRSWGPSIIYFFLLFIFVLSLRPETLIYKVGLYRELDYISCSLILLRLWVRVLCVVRRQKVLNFRGTSKKFITVINFLLVFLIFSFSFNNFLLFYVIFECSIIPVLFLILGWGYQPERAQAGIYLLFYTLFASLPLLVIVFLDYNSKGGSIVVTDFYLKAIKGSLNIFIVGAFLVKFPIYITHLWLPKAHVEAPVAGSMILAGVLLKLGGYGIVRFLGLRNSFPFFLQSFLVFFRVWGGFVISLRCLRQTDIKSLIACSSVVHIRTCIGSLLIFSEWGKQGAVLIIIAHGLCSSGLFFLAGIIYNLTNSRRLLVNKGLLNIIPSIRLGWFLLLRCNIACPPTINLLSEIKIIRALLSWRYFLCLPLALLAFFRCAYRIYLYSLSQHGKFLFRGQRFQSRFIIDFLIVFFHWLPLNIYILFVYLILCFFSLYKISFCGGEEVVTKSTRS